MVDLPHLFPPATARTEPYLSPRQGGGGEFRTPPRDRVAHSAKLVGELEAAAASASAGAARPEPQPPPKGIVLDFEADPDFKLQLKSLEIRQSGIELRNSRTEGT